MVHEKEIILKAQTSKRDVRGDGRSFPRFSATWGRLEGDFYLVSGSLLTFEGFDLITSVCSSSPVKLMV